MERKKPASAGPESARQGSLLNASDEICSSRFLHSLQKFSEGKGSCLLRKEGVICHLTA